MAISDKLNYLIETKQLFKDRLNSLGAEIIESTTFRNYLNWLDTFYNQSSDKTDLAENGVVGRTSQESTTGKNLFDKDNTNIINGAFINALSHQIGGNTNAKCLFLEIEPSTTYTISKTKGNRFAVGTSSTLPAIGTALSHILDDRTKLSLTVTGSSDSKYLVVYFTLAPDTGSLEDILATIQVEKGSTATSYEPYTGGQSSPNPDYPQPINNLTGNVSYKITTQNGEQTFTIPLGDIELGKITTYKDKIYSSDGRFYLKKEINKINSYNGEIVTTDYKSTTGGLDTGATVYYGINTITTEITSSNYPELYAALKEIQDYLVSYKINKEFLLDYSSPEIEY